jgi:hypothetical protein
VGVAATFSPTFTGVFAEAKRFASHCAPTWRSCTRGPSTSKRKRGFSRRLANELQFAGLKGKRLPAPSSRRHPTPEWIKKISDMHLFDEGWNKLRETIFANQKKLGVIPQDAKLTPWPKDRLLRLDLRLRFPLLLRCCGSPHFSASASRSVGSSSTAICGSDLHLFDGYQPTA